MRKMFTRSCGSGLGTLSQPTEARGRGFGSQDFSGHAVPKLHVRQFGDGGFVLRFGHMPYVKPHHIHRYHHGLFVGMTSAGTFGRGTIATLRSKIDARQSDVYICATAKSECGGLWRPVRESNPCRRREREAIYRNSKETCGMDSTVR